jgi:penicillin-binding protein 2
MKINGKPVKIPSKKIRFSTKHMLQIRQGMYEACNVRTGTAYDTLSQTKAGLPIVVAGKTGTAQVVSIPQEIKKRVKEDEMAYFRKSHAWITTYAPFRKPEYVVTVLIEHGGHGGSAAGPVAADIYKWLYVNGYFHDHPKEQVQAPLKAKKSEAEAKQRAFFDKLRQQQAQAKQKEKNSTTDESTQ